jgi:hypothetical protein
VEARYDRERESGKKSGHREGPIGRQRRGVVGPNKDEFGCADDTIVAGTMRTRLPLWKIL